jgi:hypothetical protein
MASRWIWWGVCAAVIIGFALWGFGDKRRQSNKHQQLAYERFASLGDPGAVKAAVDKHHARVFRETYRFRGWKGFRFDAERYFSLMDALVKAELKRSELRKSSSRSRNGDCLPGGGESSTLMRSSTPSPIAGLA